MEKHERDDAKACETALNAAAPGKHKETAEAIFKAARHAGILLKKIAEGLQIASEHGFSKDSVKKAIAFLFGENVPESLNDLAGESKHGAAAKHHKPVRERED